MAFLFYFYGICFVGNTRMSFSKQSLLDIVSSGLDALNNNTTAQNRYILKLEQSNELDNISIYSVDLQEQLDKPWRYTIIFTSANRSLSIDAILKQPASFSFLQAPMDALIGGISLLSKPPSVRTVHGIVTEFSLLSVSKDEARYQIVLQPKLALLKNNIGSAIYQNQNVVSVVESILRQHGFTGIDYRLELKQNYPTRELITQWKESDLNFILRLLADVGIWLRFETHEEHNCDVIVLGDEQNGFTKHGTITHKTPSGMEDSSCDSIWALEQSTFLALQTVTVNDYNYRQAKDDMLSSANTVVNSSTTYGNDYRYDEHYKNQQQDQNENFVESGNWYAKIRHQLAISRQQIICGQCNDFTLAPGQQVFIENSQLGNIEDGVLILTTRGKGDRSTPYRIEFTAIPFNLLKPYRPQVLPSPEIKGTLPARVTSPDNDTYGYIDIHGRYRVKFNFDLAQWRSGKESLWIRLARSYAGNQYGFHFPLIDGTEVGIGFTNGNPDRPYIAHAMHDSAHPDHVTTINKHRNVIRTPTNNKLRMDDKRGQEHIKLATEYGKTQLNIGHLVNNKKEQRGEGFELRTDMWGAIAADRGLYLTSQTEPKAQGKQLDMQGAITELENALSIAKALQNVSEKAESHVADIDSQQQLQSTLEDMNQPGILAYAQKGIALSSPENIQLSSANSASVTTANQTDITALKNITLSTSEAISLLAQKSGMKLFANQGDVDVQAQTNQIAVAAKHDVQINSVDSNVDFAAAQEITLICCGSYIKISAAGIELGTQDNVYLKCNAMQKMAPNSLSNLRNLSDSVDCQITQNDQVGKQQACIDLN